MKVLAASLVSVLAMIASANAADAVVEEVVIVDAAAPAWSGFYAGAHVGYAWASRDWNGEFAGIPVDDNLYDYSMDGALAGAQIGYNWQVDQFVFGVEADASWADGSDTETVLGILGTEAKSEMDWMATIRGRVGYAWDRFLVYGTGGVAFARVSTDVTQDLFFTTQSDSASATHTGWTAGVGVEALVTEKVSVKLEYLHADFGDKSYDYNLFPISPDDDTIGSADLTVDSIKLGVNFHF